MWLLAFCVAVLMLAIWMSFIEPRLIQINRRRIYLKKTLHHPIRILHLSDTHFNTPKKWLDRFFDKLAKLDVHYVVLTGDIMDCTAGIPNAVENLKKIKPSHGYFAVLGNHDYYDYRFLDAALHNFPGQSYPGSDNDVQRLCRELKEVGIRVLRNETLSLDFEGTPLLVHGLDDATTGHANIRLAMDKFNKSKLNFLLTHTIDVFFDIGEDEIDLAFSGHSHGGQIRFPFIGPIITHTMMGRPYADGIKQIRGALCCVSRGVSAGRFISARLLCRPEAVLLEVYGRSI